MADVIKKATREAYGAALAELGAVNEKVIVLDADLAEATKQVCSKKHSLKDFLIQVLQNAT